MAADDPDKSGGSSPDTKAEQPKPAQDHKGSAMLKKRGREGSLEPYLPETPSQQNLTTKKNRLRLAQPQPQPQTQSSSTENGDRPTSPNSDLGAETEAEAASEIRNVEGVRQRVEQMSYTEGEGRNGHDDGQDVILPEENEDDAAPKTGDSLMTTSTQYTDGSAMSTDTGYEEKWVGKAMRENGGGGDEGWEEVGDEEISEAKEAEAGLVSKQKEKEKEGTKRKALDRSESGVQGESEVKRTKETPSPPKKDKAMPSTLPADSDNENEMKPSTDGNPITKSEPNPESAPPVPGKKPNTFSAFASTSSPFAPKSSTTATTTTSTNAFGSSSTPSKPLSGFGGYSSSFSPFAAKGKPTSIFGSDSGNKGLNTERDKDGEDGAEEVTGVGMGGESSSFGDILKRESKGVEDEERVQMSAQDVPTGEEDENTVYQTRAKLYVMQSDGGWRERGVGMLRLNSRVSDGKGARLVMRAEGVLRLILNVSLYVGMACLEDGKHVRTTVFEEGERRFITLRTSSQKAASELVGAISELIPIEGSGMPASEKEVV